MYDIFSVLRENKREAIKLLEKAENKTIVLAAWDEDSEEYEANGDNGTDECYIRVADDDGNVDIRLVVAVRYDGKVIDVCLSESIYDKSDTAGEKNWMPLSWADDISEYQVYDAVGAAAGAKFIRVD